MHKRFPKDFKQYVRRKILFRVIPCGILLLTLWILLALFGGRLFRTDNTIFRVSCYLVTMILPFAITGVPFRLLDRTYWGTVEEVRIETTLESTSAVKPSVESLYRKNTVYLTVLLPNGKYMDRKVCEGRAEHGTNLEAYQKGEHVFHLYGSRYTVVLPRGHNGPAPCAVCGDQNDATDRCCRSCGHTLVKDPSLWRIDPNEQH